MYKLIAHRGNTKNAKENTMRAFLEALKESYMGFECDVRMTKDNKLIIFHDPLYKGRLVKLTSLKKMDNPLLFSDLLQINTSKIILIDIKDPFIDINRFVSEINMSDAKNIYIMSMYENTIKELSKKIKKYKIGLLNYFYNSNKLIDKYDFLCIPYSSFSQKLMNNLKRYNKKLFIFQIKEKDIHYKYPYYIVD